MIGKLIIFSAPSGSGKTTIVKYLLNNNLNLEFSISATTRHPRQGELNGHDYYFITTDDFQHKIHDNQFVEWEEVYPGNYYGTLRSELERIWSHGNHVVFDIDVKGGLHLKNLFPEHALSVFVRPPSLKELETRLILRSTDEPETIKKRIEKAEYELTFADQFDVILVNDYLDAAKEKALQIVSEFINS
jgi:guanylate kinase